MALKYKLMVSDLAEDELKRLSHRMSKNRLIKLREKILKTYINIQEMPWMYPRLYYEKKTKTDFRKIVYQNYIIIYKIQKNQITILRIVSVKENYLKPKLLEIY